MHEEVDEAWFKDISDATVVYAAMLGATVGAQLAGILLNVALGWHQLWMPALLSIVLEAVAGARGMAARRGRPLTPPESLRLSITYSIGLFIVTGFLGIWTVLARPMGSAPLVLPLAPALLLPLVVLAAAVGTILRWGLMMAFAPKAGPGAGEEREEQGPSLKGPTP